MEYSFVNMNLEKSLATIPVSPDYHTAVQNNSTTLENETLSVLHQSHFISSNISGQRSNELTDIETIVSETWGKYWYLLIASVQMQVIRLNEQFIRHPISTELVNDVNTQ